MNARDYGKRLEELQHQSKTKVEDIELTYNSVLEIKKKIEEYLAQATELNEKITDEETGLQAILESAQELKNNINTSKVNADAQLQKITEALNSVQSNIEEMETAYTEFTELNEKITDEETGLQAILESAQELKNNINTSKVNADAQLQKITEALNSVQSNIEEMETAYTEFTELNEKITDEETGLQAILDQAAELKSEIVAVKSNAETVYKEIRIFRDNAAEYIKEIENFKGNADNTTQKIQNKYDESAELEKKIQEIFDIGTKGAHANYFVERRNQIMLVFIAWGVVSLLCLTATVFLAVHFIAPMADKMKHSLDVNLSALLLRFSILTPTTFAFIYSLNQYSQERRLYEKYAFKAISTYSIETSLNTLLRSTKGLSDQSRDKKITDFAICTFNSIYQEPIETKKERWSFGVGNKILKLTAETNQTVGKIHQEVDNLKDLAKQEMSE